MNNLNNFMKEKVSVETLQVCNRKYAQNCIFNFLDSLGV